jgi:hypothetical protein
MIMLAPRASQHAAVNAWSAPIGMATFGSPALIDHGVAARQELVLGDVALDADVRRLRPKVRRVDVPPDGDREVVGLVTQAGTGRTPNETP